MTRPAFGDLTANDRTLSLVKGYHRHSYPPELAHKAGLLNRFAVVLDSYRHGNVDWFFDAELFLAMMTAICDSIPHDEISLEMEDGSKKWSLDGLSTAFARVDKMDREPPQLACLFECENLVCVVEIEFWVRVGGPPPYHDSYTFSFYTANDCAAEFQRLCEQVSEEFGAIVTEVSEGVSRKKPFRPWWKRMLNAVGVTR